MLTISGTTFLLSIILSIGSNGLLAIIPFVLSFVVLFFIVFIGVCFDIVGVAAAAGQETPFHAMASNRLDGAKQCIWLVRNADQVATYCSDVVGDIAGTLSGAIAAAIVFRIVLIGPRVNETIVTTVLIGLVAALTVFGKAMGKTVAINRSTDILYKVGRILFMLERVGIKIAKDNLKKKPKRLEGK